MTVRHTTDCDKHVFVIVIFIVMSIIGLFFKIKIRVCFKMRYFLRSVLLFKKSNIKIRNSASVSFCCGPGAEAIGPFT